MNDPKAVLAQFIDSLPVTIKENVLALCAMSYGTYDYTEGRADVAGLLAMLSARPFQLEGYRCAMLAGAIEVALSPDAIDRQAMVETLAEQSGSTIFATSAAQEPLKQRHLGIARETFQQLRTGALSPASLREWSARLVG